jgi:WD40 repeat protein
MDLKRSNTNKIISASSDNTMCLWNLNTEKSVYLAGHTNDVHQIIDLKAFNEYYIASCSADSNIKIWNIKETNSIMKLSGHTNCVSMILHLDKLDKELLLSCSLDCTIRLWNISSGKEELCIKGHTGSVTKIIHPYKFQRSLIISSSLDMKIKLWEIKKIESDNEVTYRGIYLREFIGHDDGIYDILYLKGCFKNEIFISASQDRSIRIWSLETNIGLRKLSTKGNVSILKQLKKYNPHYFASGGTDNYLYIWNALTGDKVHVFQGLKNPINIVYPKDIDNEIIVVSDDKDLKVFNFVKGTLLRSIKDAHDDIILYLMYSASKEIIVSGCSDASIKIWKLNR